MGTDWEIIGEQLRLDKYRILSLIIIAVVGVTVVLCHLPFLETVQLFGIVEIFPACFA